MSDNTVKDAVIGELNGLGDVDRVIRAGELIELLNRELVVMLADVRGVSVRRLRQARDLTDAEISTGTKVSPQQLRKLDERGRYAQAGADGRYFESVGIQ